MSSEEEPLPEKVGPYKILERIAKGGMGEVYLAYDDTCQRRVALKRIREDMKEREVLVQRFLREAHITAQLNHPGIVPIYAVHTTGDELYYTMPYVEGRTLKQILKAARNNEERDIGSIQNLIPIFTNVCQAVAYAHHQGVIHRDLKPDNIIVGSFGEVYILDWGLSKWIREPEEEGEEIEVSEPDVTLPGKVFGTVTYMAPERAFGHPATHLSDVYALGIILYEILALYPPFKRENIKAFRKGVKDERFLDPATMAPYRNVPRLLSQIARKAMHPRTQLRTQEVDDLIRELQNYLQGRSEWFEIAALDPTLPDHWEFREHIYMAENMALTGGAAGTEWVTMMVSKASYPGDVRLEAMVTIGEEGSGIGLLWSIPERAERQELNSGYYLWLGSDLKAGALLFRSGVQVANLPALSLKRRHEVHLRIEKVDHTIHLFVDGQRKLSYVSELPMLGTHVGLLMRDGQVSLARLHVAVGNYSVEVGCLAVPDAFLAAGDYSRALSEYRRVGYSFPERDEGREALFRAGITLIEEAKHTGKIDRYDQALREFEKLQSTPGAPLEYLGKALVYRSQSELDEEAKCFELAFRKYAGHPLLSVLEEQLVHLLHASSRTDRRAAYRFMLLATQHLGKRFEQGEVQRLVQQLERHWEPLPFMQSLPKEQAIFARDALAIRLAFWLARPLTLTEVVNQLPKPKPRALIANAEAALSELREGTTTDNPVWQSLLDEKWQEAADQFAQHTFEELHQESSLLFLLYGCYLAHTEGEELALVHFAGARDTPYPRSWTLLAHYLTGKISLEGRWGRQAFLYERRQLYRQLHLWAHCLGSAERAAHWAELARQETT